MKTNRRKMQLESRNSKRKSREIKLKHRNIKRKFRKAKLNFRQHKTDLWETKPDSNPCPPFKAFPNPLNRLTDIPNQSTSVKIQIKPANRINLFLNPLHFFRAF